MFRLLDIMEIIFDQINIEELRRKEKVMRLLKEQVRKNEEIISEL